jgi:hypothetical protein
MQSLTHLCADIFVVFQVDAKNLLGIVNRGSPRLNLNALARELFWLGLDHRITLTVEWVPREQNTQADELSKLLIPEDCSLGMTIFLQLEDRWGCHFVDLFASNANNLCGDFTPCIGAKRRGVSMPSLIIGAGRPSGSTARIGWWVVCGESWSTAGV